MSHNTRRLNTLDYGLLPCKTSILKSSDTIFLLHGLGLNSRLWHPLAEQLAEHYQILSCDLRGHGESRQLPIHELSWDGLCAELDNVLLASGLKNAPLHLVGHGIGGNLAAHFAEHRPEQVRTVTLVSTIGCYSPDMFKQSLELRRRYVREAELAEQMASLITVLPSDSREAGMLRDAYRQADMSAYFEFLNLFNQSPPLDALSRLTKPCLVLGGDMDRIYPSFMSGLTAQFIPGAVYASVPDAGNVLFLEQPAYTAARINDFIASETARHRRNPDSEASETNPALGFYSPEMTEWLNALMGTGNAKTRLDVRLIGSFHVDINDRPQQTGWDQRSAKRLFVYLLFHPSTARDAVCEALWPSEEKSKAQNKLRVCLSHLRSLFKAAGCNPIYTNRSRIHLHAAVSCDVLDGIAVMKEAYAEKTPERKAELVHQAIHAFGGPLFSGLYDDWVMREQSLIEYQLEELTEWLSDWYAERGDSAGSARVRERLHLTAE